MTAIYYIEINLICIVVLLLLSGQLQQRHGRGSTENNVFRLMMFATIALCVADMISGALRGRLFPGAQAFNESSNLLYFIMATAVGYLWAVYVNIKLGNTSRTKVILWAIPLLVIIFVAVSNPWTDFLFTLGMDNLYVRSRGVYLHWIVNWMYLIVPTFQIIWEVIHESNKSRRRDFSVLLLFVIAPAIASVIQMKYYGISCFQVGITISLLIIFLVGQNVQILTDALTRLNNRQGFNNYSEEFVRRNEGTEMLLLMIDINNFKQINDKFSHVVGDQALRDTADVLKRVCAEAPCNLFLCRYGGDEFIIAGDDRAVGYEIWIKEQIHKDFEKFNSTGMKPYTLVVSIGAAALECTGMDDIERLLHDADRAMYEDKKRSKALHTTNNNGGNTTTSGLDH